LALLTCFSCGCRPWGSHLVGAQGANMAVEETPPASTASAAPAESAADSKEPTAATSAPPEKDEPQKTSGPEVAEAEGGTAAQVPAAAEAEGEPAPPPKGEEAAEVKAVEEKVDESTYGIFVDPAGSFDVAREIAREMHKTLGALKLAKADAETPGGEAGEGGNFADIARQLQLQLMSLRRAHRSMAKAADAGRTGEALARRVADAEFAHLETRRYESACCRAAARRCRSFPTPELSTLRPFLHKELGAGAQENEAEDQAEKDQGEGKAAPTRLAKWLTVEGQQRANLLEELEDMERAKLFYVDAFKGMGQFGTDLAAKLQKAKVALEPVCDHIDLRPRPEIDLLAPEPVNLTVLPAPLRLVYLKFDTLAAFGKEAGVTVQIERVEPGSLLQGGEPPAKKARLERVTRCVRVDIAAAPGKDTPADAKTVTIRFVASPTAGYSSCSIPALLIGVCGEDEPLLDSLWPDDEARSGEMSASAKTSEVPGRIYGWVQVLAGLRERVLPLVYNPAKIGGPLSEGGSVVASDVVQRVRDRLASKTPGR